MSTSFSAMSSASDRPPADSNAGNPIVRIERRRLGAGSRSRGRRRRRSGWRRGLGDGIGFVERHHGGAGSRNSRESPGQRAEAAELADDDAAARPPSRSPARSRSRSRTAAIPGPAPVWRLITADRRERSRAAQTPSAAMPQFDWKSSRARAVLGPEDAVDPPAVEPEPAEPRLQLSDVVAAHVRRRQVAAAGRRGSRLARPGRSRSARRMRPSQRRPRPVWKARTAASVAATKTAGLGAGGGWKPGGTEAALQIAYGLAALTGCQREVGRNSSSSCSSWPLPLAPTRRLRTSPLVEDEQRRDAHHVVAHGDLGVLVDVELGDGEVLGLLGRRSRSRIGAIILHGPHHSAQKSTIDRLVGAGDGLVERGGGEVTMPSAMMGSFRSERDATQWCNRRRRGPAFPRPRHGVGRPVRRRGRRPRASARRRWPPCSPSRRR